MPRAYSRDEILDAFGRAVCESSPALTIAQFSRLTGISLGPVVRHFGSWTGLRAVAGVPLGLGLFSAGDKHQRRDFLVAEARRLAGLHGERLTLQRFCREAGVSHSTIRRHFERWVDLRTAAGLSTPRAMIGYTWTEQALLQEYERVTRRLGWCPGLAEFGRHARCSTGTVKNRFGGIRRLEAAYRAWLQHRAGLPGPDGRLARHLLDCHVELSSPQPRVPGDDCSAG